MLVKLKTKIFSFGKGKDNKKTKIDNFLTWRISFALKNFLIFIKIKINRLL